MGLDRPVHSLLCSTWKKYKATPRPGVVRVIHFPGGDAEPEWRWCFEKPTDSSGCGGGLELGFLFPRGAQKPVLERWPVINNLIQGRDTRFEDEDCLQIIMLRDAVPIKEKPNLAVQRIARGGIIGSNLRGPMVLARVYDEGHQWGGMERWVDVGLRDLRTVADWFSYKDRDLAPRKEKRQGVVVGLRPANSNRPTQPYMPFMVAGNDSLFQEPGSQITNLLGIPIQARFLTRVEMERFRAAQESAAKLNDTCQTDDSDTTLPDPAISSTDSSGVDIKETSSGARCARPPAKAPVNNPLFDLALLKTSNLFLDVLSPWIGVPPENFG